jgi:hypothetical protein
MTDVTHIDAYWVRIKCQKNAEILSHALKEISLEVNMFQMYEHDTKRESAT